MMTTTKGSKTKEKLLDAAVSLMIEHGYEATSIDQICKAAQVNRGSFFYYFKSKEELGLNLIDYFSANMGKALSQGCAQCDDPLERIYSLIDCAVQMTQNPKMKGCLVGTLTQEISKSHPELRKRCHESLEKTVALFENELQAAKALHAPEKDFDVHSLAKYFVATGQGGMILMKASKEREVVGEMLKHYKHYLQQLFGK